MMENTAPKISLFFTSNSSPKQEQAIGRDLGQMKWSAAVQNFHLIISDSGAPSNLIPHL